MNKRVLILFNTYWFNKDVVSGGVIRLVEILKRIKYFDFFHLTNANGRDLFCSHKIEGKFVLTSNWFDKMTLFSSYILRTIQAIFKLRRYTFDVFYSSSDFFPDVIPAYFGKKKGLWIQVIHHIYPYWKERPGNKIVAFIGFYIQRFSFLLIKKRADIIIVVNPIIKEELIKLGFDKKKIKVSSNAIDVGFFDSISGKGKMYDGVFLGRINYCKGLLDFLEIWPKVLEKFPQAKLGIIGGGPENIIEDFKSKIAKKNLSSHIDVLGYLPNEEVVATLKSGKIFLFPSHEEGWGIAIAEAMASKLPVISWNLPAYKDVFKNYIFSIPENDFTSFAEKIIELLADEKKIIKISQEGYNFIHKYSWDEIAKEEFSNI